MDETKVAIFENFEIRRQYDEKTEIWYFSVIDIIAVLTDQTDYNKAKTYWTTLKNRLKNEGSEVVTKCDRLKMIAQDGKMRFTDAANPETIFRLIQSVPSPKAEPIKLWLAKVGYERIQEISDPERSLNRARENWKKHGRSEKWIQRRMMGQETRNKLTDYWKDNEVKEKEEFAILTNIIHQEWSDLTVKEHKNLKGLKTQNLRDQEVCPPDHVAAQVIHDSYTFLNRQNTNGTPLATFIYHQVDCNGLTAIPTRGRDIFDDTSTPGVSCGTLDNIPRTCSADQGYWATNQSCSTLSGLTGDIATYPTRATITGSLYKCGSNNDWSIFYTPYTYPHPLRNETPTPPPPLVTYNITNFTQLVTDWLKNISNSPADVNADGSVNAKDLGIMMSKWK